MLRPHSRPGALSSRHVALSVSVLVLVLAAGCGSTSPEPDDTPDAGSAQRDAGSSPPGCEVGDPRCTPDAGTNTPPCDAADAGCTPDAGSVEPSCTPGAQRCEPDGVYTCGADGRFQRTAACGDCNAQPSPHCPVNCANGATSVCEGDGIRDCQAGTVSSCGIGRCVAEGSRGVCVTRPGGPCMGTNPNGSRYALACATGDQVATDQVCDLRTGQCQAGTFDCMSLDDLEDGQVTCDASGDFLSACVNGQPRAISCEGSTACATDGSLNCYTPPNAGEACGGPAVCARGFHCNQAAADTASCIRPTSTSTCSPSDKRVVCSDIDTAVACHYGSVWQWRNLTRWGGSCSGGVPVIPAGGNCIPGLAACASGLACVKTRYDVAGVCRPPAANAPAECTLTSQVSTGLSCVYQWNSCLNGKRYGVSCSPVRVGAYVITACDCLVDGARTKTFGGDAACNVTSTVALDTLVRQECGWPLTTVDVAD